MSDKLADEISAAVAKELAAREAKQPRNIELDPYEKVIIDNILWRETAARRAIELANRDLSDAGNMRDDLIKKVRQKNKLDDSINLSIDMQRKTATAQPK